MADITITPANVKLAGTLGQTRFKPVLLGEALDPGETVYKHTDQAVWKATNDETAAKADVAGVILIGGSAGGVGLVAYEGPVEIGGTLAAGMNYVLSSNDGMICPVTDLGSGDRIVSLGHATTTGILWLDIENYEAAVP